MRDAITWVGLDVHKASINVAMFAPNAPKAVQWQVANECQAVRRMVRKIARASAGEVRVCYEAGPCGYVLQRQLHEHEEIVCEVIAPSLIPAKVGDRVKTDRRDALKLAELFRAGLLTEVHAPSEDEEWVRDLCRAREDAKQDLQRCRHRLSKFFLRHGIRFDECRPWSRRYMDKVRQLRLDNPSAQAVLDDYILGVSQHDERVLELERRMSEVAQSEPYGERVSALMCFRGIAVITAMTIVAEIHDFRRFKSPRQLMAYLGLVPSEYSSGGSQNRGAITKTGNTHVRRVLVEAAWHYRHPPRVGVTLRKRREGQPGAVIALADKAQRRLHQRYRRLSERKPKNKAVVAVARELAGFVWAAMHSELRAPA